ncbi:MAG: chloride channel protein [Barnesiella sp.]|nr:chloride channel protein [Barnesiella sp.]
MASWTDFKGKIYSKAAAQAVAGQGLMTEKKFLIVTAVGVGLITGVGAEALRFIIGKITAGTFWLMDALDANWLLLLLPVVGVVLCGIYCRYVLKDDMEFGCQRIHDALLRKDYRMRGHIVYGPIVSCALTLGFGGSAGSEGPIAYAGAGIGSNVGKLFGLSPNTLRILIGCGAGAGIAGIFKAPVGGALFAIEVLGVEFTTMSVMALAACCVASWFTSYVCSGMTLDLPMHIVHSFDAALIPAALLLGLCCGFYSLYYNFLMDKAEHAIMRVGNPWVKNVASGLMIGGCLFLFPALYGEGYGVVGGLINGHDAGLLSRSLFGGSGSVWIPVVILAGILAVKSFACGMTNAGGGVGGDFAPTLFAGCMAGMLFASVSNLALGTSLPVADFALFGMAGVMAGTIQAPLMAMFLTVEMTGHFDVFFPLMVTALISFVTVRLFTNKTGIPTHPSWLHRGVDDFISRF